LEDELTIFLLEEPYQVAYLQYRNFVPRIFHLVTLRELENEVAQLD
jgi:hypothetical protein